MLSPWKRGSEELQNPNQPRESPPKTRAARFTPQQAEGSSEPENSTAFNGSEIQSTVFLVGFETTTGKGPDQAAGVQELFTAPKATRSMFSTELLTALSPS